MWFFARAFQMSLSSLSDVCEKWVTLLFIQFLLLLPSKTHNSFCCKAVRSPLPRVPDSRDRGKSTWLDTVSWFQFTSFDLIGFSPTNPLKKNTTWYSLFLRSFNWCFSKICGNYISLGRSAVPLWLALDFYPRRKIKKKTFATWKTCWRWVAGVGGWGGRLGPGCWVSKKGWWLVGWWRWYDGNFRYDRWRME